MITKLSVVRNDCFTSLVSTADWNYLYVTSSIGSSTMGSLSSELRGGYR